MLCPNCKIEMNNGICVKCGYMSNGNYITQYKKEDKNIDIRLYNEDFDSMNSNQRKWLNFVLGSFYFSYRRHIFVGIIIGIINFLIFILMANFISALHSIGSVFDLFAFFTTVFYVLINRVLYMSFSNHLCLVLDSFKIKMIKKKNENYIEKLVKHKSSSVLYIFFSLLIYAVVVALIFYLK